MSKQREALELAQKAIAAIELTDDFELTVKASRAIREALSEPEQVAWFKGLPKGTTHIATLTATVNCGGRIETMTRAFKYANADLLVYYTDSDNEHPEWVKAKSIYPQWDFSTVVVPLYTTPPARKPLTDEQIEDCLPMGIAEYTTVCGKSEIRKFARAIERAHGIE